MSGDFQTVLKSLNSNIAREIEELLLMKQDLDRAIKCVEAWADIFDKNDNSDRHEVITSSLFRNCIITFMACFDTATPHNLNSTEVYSGIEGGAEYFRWLKDMRDTWIAHRSGPMRQAAVGAIIKPGTGDIEGMGYLYSIEGIGNVGVDKDLRRFIKFASDFVERKISHKMEAHKREFTALHANQRERLPEARIVTPTEDQKRMGRRKFRNISQHKA